MVEIPRNRSKNIDKSFKSLGTGLIILGTILLLMGIYLSFLTPKIKPSTSDSEKGIHPLIDTYFLGIFLIILGNTSYIIGGMLLYAYYVRKSIRERLIGTSETFEVK
ncbi:MAG: hypothetical protein ACFFCQ_05170 [Promethearchaeota archaeon]